MSACLWKSTNQPLPADWLKIFLHRSGENAFRVTNYKQQSRRVEESSGGAARRGSIQHTNSTKAKINQTKAHFPKNQAEK